MGDFQNSYREEIEAFEKDYPVREMQLSKGKVSYIFSGPREAAYTLVLVNGGMDSSEMWLRYIKDFSRDYQVLAFDFPCGYDTLQDLCVAMHEMFHQLSIRRGILIGASLGGLISELFAVKYPAETDGLVLMSTGGFTEATRKRYALGLKMLTPMIGLMKVLPYSWFIRMEKKMMAGYLKEADAESRKYFRDMVDHVYENFSREKDLHVTRLQKDMENQAMADRKDFTYLAGRVLLLLPEDDTEFPPQAREELKNLMTDPVVVSGIHGGHLTTMVYYQNNIRYIRSFLEGL